MKIKLLTIHSLHGYLTAHWADEQISIAMTVERLMFHLIFINIYIDNSVESSIK